LPPHSAAFFAVRGFYYTLGGAISGLVDTLMNSHRILMFHKPKGVLVTRADELLRRTVYDVLPRWVLSEGWVPVGRLDRDSRGLLLFVRGGLLVDALTGPGSPQKVYEVWVRGRVTEAHLQALRRGVKTAAGTLSCLGVEVLGVAGPKTNLRITLDEGKNRHIRRVFGALRDLERGTPLKVLELKRLAIGSLTLDVPSRAWRFLTETEEEALLQGGSG
jgi:23S rRNA pseudouridine2605 synthase